VTGAAGTVGLVGVGAMGRGIAKNLGAAGFAVRGFDLSDKRLAELEEFGGQAVSSPAEAASGADWLVLCLPGHEQVVDVLFGAGAAAAAAPPGCVVIDTSTSLPEESIAVSQRLTQRGLAFVDASLSGTGATIMHKDVVALVGGSPEDVRRCAPVFDGFARAYHHLGPVGSGALGKLLVNVVVVGNRLALAESLALGMKAGMDPHALLAILKDGPAYSRAMDLKGEKMITADFRPESTLEQSLHGAELLLAQARRVGSPLFGAAVYSQVAQAAVAMGFGHLDPAALVEALLVMGGAEPRG